MQFQNFLAVDCRRFFSLPSPIVFFFVLDSALALLNLLPHGPEKKKHTKKIQLHMLNNHNQSLISFGWCYPLDKIIITIQGWIHTGFPRFMEIGQIFHNKHIFNNNNNRTFKVEIWKMVWTNAFFFQFLGIRQKPGKENFRDLKSQNIPRGACPRAPLEACSLGPSFRKSVSIYPRSAPAIHCMDIAIGFPILKHWIVMISLVDIRLLNNKGFYLCELTKKRLK